MTQISCVVEKALESLTNNLGIGVNFVKFTSTDDDDRTAKLFKMLKDKGETFSPNMVYDWAINHVKWQEEEADKLAEIADSVLRGTAKISQIPYWRDNLIDDFQDECEK
jgi:hypothetical protein